MKKFMVSLFVLSACLMVWLPVSGLAQSQFPYLPPPTSYQPYYSPNQPYVQPSLPPAYTQPGVPPAYTQPGMPPSYTQPGMPPSGYPYYPPSLTVCWSDYRYNPTQMYRCGLSLVYAKRYYEAVQVFQYFLQRYPQSGLADNAVYWTGECYYAQKRYHTALSYFQRVLFEYPRGNKVPDATLKIALSYISMKQYARGCQILDDLIYRYPNSESAGKAYRWLGRCGRSPDPYYDRYDPPYSYGDTSLPKNW